MFAAAALAASLALAGVHAAPVANLATVEAALSPSNTTHHNASVVTNMNGNAGACGWYSKDSDLVAGLPLEQYTDLGSASPFCGQYIVVVDPRDNTTATLLVADASTQNNTLSLSQGSFAALNGSASDLQVVDWRFANETETEAAKSALSSGSSSPKASSTSSWVAPSSTSSWVAPSSTSSWVAPSSTSAYVAPSSSSSAAKEYKQESTTSYAPKTTTTTTKAYTPPTTSYAPKTTTTSYAPKPTTTQAAATKAASNYKSSSSSGSSGSYSGTATYFYQNGVAGACGTVHSDSDYIIALQTSMYSGGSNCGRTVSINGNGKTITAKVADECPTCVSSGSIDLSEAAFKSLAGLDAGVVSVTWDFQ
ncbi:hypothetical protein JCM10213v2_000365 [Rhodosporidiobolus nylandii]